MGDKAPSLRNVWVWKSYICLLQFVRTVEGFSAGISIESSKCFNKNRGPLLIPPLDPVSLTLTLPAPTIAALRHVTQNPTLGA